MTQRNMFRELQLKIYDFVYCDTVIQPSPLVDGPPGGSGGGGGGKRIRFLHPPRAEPKWYQNDRMNLLFQNRDVPIKIIGLKTPNLHKTRWPP